MKVSKLLVFAKYRPYSKLKNVKDFNIEAITGNLPRLNLLQ